MALLTSLKADAAGRALQDALGISSAASARVVASFEEARGRQVLEGFSEAERWVGRRLGQVQEQMTRPPPAGGPLDETTRPGVTAGVRDLRTLLSQQNAQVDAAERFRTRQERAMLALILAAVAAVLLGVAGLSERRAGKASIALAAVVLVVALGWGRPGF